MRLERGPNPPMTCKAEFYEPPTNQPIEVFGSGGVEVDHQGVVWQNWRTSGHFSAFDRSKCKTTRDPKATGQSCPEGWTFYRKNDPTFDGSPFHANESYLTHMDVHDVLGLGKDAPMYGSNNTDAFEVIQVSTKQFVTLARAVSARLLPAFGQRSRRRSEGRLEGQGPVGQLLHLRHLAYRRRQGRRRSGRAAQSRQVPDATESARQVGLPLRLIWNCLWS